MTSRPIKDFHPGSVVFTVEWMGDEFRETYYRVDEPRPCLYPSNIPCARYGLVQAAPNAEDLRYVRIDKPACRDPGEIDGRTPVRLLQPGVSGFYERLFRPADV